MSGGRVEDLAVGSRGRERQTMSYLRTKIVQSRWTLAAALMFGAIACSSESPTAPNNGGGGSGGGGGTPPQGASLNVAVSNANPVVSSTSTITATVTNNGAPVPDGTAVEFSTTRGTFTDTATSTTIRTTTNGVATATLTSTEAGPARVTVRVSNVSRQVDVEFRVEDPGDGGGGGLAITGIDPAMSSPAGGNIISIRGTGFDAPVRVLFGTREASVVSVTETEIRVVVPSIQLGATEQSREVNVTVINNAGTEEERSVVAPTTFRYQAEVLTPVVYTISPSTGPNEGNTRITIMGEGFQSPVKVFFGAPATRVEVEVLQVTYNQIVALTPPALGMGADLRDSSVPVRVLNVASNTFVDFDNAFRYGPAMQITAVSPGEGPYTGGTQVTIHGWGFDDPVAVSIGGVAAQPIRVSGTEIVVRTAALLLDGCDDVTGPVTVTNVEDGASAAGPAFIYRVPNPTIIAVTPGEPTAGNAFSVTVSGAGNPSQVRFKIGDRTVLPSGATTNADGTTTFNVTVPSNIELEEEACPAGGTRQVPTTFDLTFQNTATGCEDVLSSGVTVLPPGVAELFVTNPEPAALTAEVGSSATSAFDIVNTGNDLLDVLGVTSSNPQFTVTNVTDDLGACQSAGSTITFTPTAAGTQTSTITVSTANGGTRSFQISGTGTAPAP